MGLQEIYRRWLWKRPVSNIDQEDKKEYSRKLAERKTKAERNEFERYDRSYDYHPGDFENYGE